MNENNLAPIAQNNIPVNPMPDVSPPIQPINTPPGLGNPQSPDSSQPKKSGSMGRIGTIFLVLLLSVAVGAGAYVYGKSKAPTKTETVTKTVKAAELTVPQGATVFSQCVPGKGTLSALPENIPTGPVYLVNQGKTIGLEFMVGKDDLFSGKNFLNLPLSNQQYDHINIGILSQGHAGFPSPHYHVDVFMVPDSVASAITCPAA